MTTEKNRKRGVQKVLEHGAKEPQVVEAHSTEKLKKRKEKWKHVFEIDSRGNSGRYKFTEANSRQELQGINSKLDKLTRGNSGIQALSPGHRAGQHRGQCMKYLDSTEHVAPANHQA